MTQNQAALAFHPVNEPAPPPRTVRERIETTAEAVAVADSAWVAHLHEDGWERRGLLGQLRRKRLS